jgi:hypothetical protein
MPGPVGTLDVPAVRKAEYAASTTLTAVLMVHVSVRAPAFTATLAAMPGGALVARS